MDNKKSYPTKFNWFVRNSSIKLDEIKMKKWYKNIKQNKNKQINEKSKMKWIMI